MFTSFVPSFRRQILFLYPPPSCGSTALRLVYPLHAPIADPALIVVLQSITILHDLSGLYVLEEFPALCIDWSCFVSAGLGYR